MKPSLFITMFISTLGLVTQSSVFALGSFMFCVNKNNSHDWKWAPAQSTSLQGYEHFVPANTKGTWIYGLGGVNKHLHSVLNVSNIIYGSTYAQNVIEAQKFCSALQKICTDKYGADYTHIGVSGHAVAQASWSYIEIKYHVTDDNFLSRTPSYTCPNWNYPEGG